MVLTRVAAFSHHSDSVERNRCFRWSTKRMLAVRLDAWPNWRFNGGPRFRHTPKLEVLRGSPHPRRLGTGQRSHRRTICPQNAGYASER